MPQKPASLDELIAKKAEEFADQVRAAAALADKEEEIRIEVEKQLAFVQREAGVKLQGKHEFTVASGRVDSVYNCVIIEYKNPSSPGARIGPGANSPGTKKVVEQIKSRFYDMRSKQTLNTLFGVGCDGNHFVFVRFYNDKWQVQDPVEVNKHSAERFLWALFNLGTKGKRFEPDYLAGDFGSGAGSVASAGIKVLYDAISSTTNPKAQTFFNQWKILFGEVCGYDVDNPSDKIKKLGDFYGVPTRDIKAAELLFSVHTYYALFMKLLAGEIIGHFHKLPSLIGRMLAAPSAAKLKQELSDLEAGGIFRHLGITNFLEGDLFAWYLPAWSPDVEDLIRKMTARLDQYNPGTLAEEPAESRDMLKKLYQQLFPKSVRHDLGEYYTPDWLAEHVLNELGYVGDPDKRLLDPACGSGTFLVMAITRIRAWYEKNREELRYDEGELCKKILANIIGFDLNPLAVMAARTNYLIAIRDLVSHVEKVEIPVYLCDSILTPSTYGGLFAGTTDAAKELKTSAAKFLVPTEIANSREDVAKYAEQLELCVRNGYQPSEFVQRCQDEGLPISAESLHIDLYKELVKLDKANKNGVWARIIKNAFAPLFVGQVDYLAGNPPWINWNNLPAEYRAASKPLWQHFDLWPRYILGASADFSKLFFYTCLDAYAVSSGKIGFVITQSIFKTFGGNQFRQFRLPLGEGIRTLRVDDLVSLQPFEGATNRTAVIVAQRGQVTEYPVKYIVWNLKARDRLDTGAALDEALRFTSRAAQIAVPILDDDPTSAWLTQSPVVARVLKKATGHNAYESFIGIHTYGANGVYFLHKQSERAASWLVTNDVKGIKTEGIEEETFAIEPELVARLLRGRNVQEDGIEQDQYLIFPYDENGQIISERDMKRRFPKGYAFLLKYKALLSARSEYVRRGSKGPWYELFCLYAGTFSPHKVVWREQSATLTPGIIVGDEQRPIVPDHKLMFIPCWSKEETGFLHAVLSSTIIRLIVQSVSIETQNSTRVMDALAIPKFNETSAVHRELARLGQRSNVREGQEKIDSVAAKLWNLSSEDQQVLRSI